MAASRSHGRLFIIATASARWKIDCSAPLGFVWQSIKVTSGPRYKNECGIYSQCKKKEIVNEKWHNGILMDCFFSANTNGVLTSTLFLAHNRSYRRQYEIVCIVAMVNSSIIVILHTV
jgi:hypothetical protein